MVGKVRFEASVVLSVVAAFFVVHSSVGADFDGTGFMDLAIGVPGERINGHDAAGAINSIYGSSSGLNAAGHDFFHQDSAGINGAAENNDAFGHTLAVGDFDGDGFLDLAVGVPYEDVGTVPNAGAVNIIYGGLGGLSSANNQLWTQADCAYVTEPEETDLFGAALAAGDLDGDGYDDLAIGAPFEDVGSTNSAGAVIVLFGSPSGLEGDGVWLTGNNTSGTSDESDYFGRALIMGDFDGDGFDDLAVGVPGDLISGQPGAGSVVLMYGDSTGLAYPATGGIFHQDIAGVHGAAEADDAFGSTLTAGDFDRDGFADLVVGVPDEDVDLYFNTGMINVFYGSSAGITATGNAYFHQENLSIAVSHWYDDHFGKTLTSGDFNGDGYCDIAVGVPDEDLGSSLNDAGFVDILWGGFGGISGAAAYISEADMNGGSNGSGDSFGYSLAAGDFNHDGRVDLAIGSPYWDDPIGLSDTGRVYVAYGVARGVSPQHGFNVAEGDVFDQCSGIAGECEAYDLFGFSLASDPRSDAYVFASGFESGNTIEWELSSP